MTDVDEKKPWVSEEDLQTLRSLAWLIGIGAFLLWLGYVYYAAGAEPSKAEAETLADSTILLKLQLALTFPAEDRLLETRIQFRLVPHKEGNVELFMTKEDFESVPYPERQAFVKQIGGLWCAHLDSFFFLPSVQIRDIRSGDKLASYSCALEALKRELR
jgi:hypothetical protein